MPGAFSLQPGGTCGASVLHVAAVLSVRAVVLEEGHVHRFGTGLVADLLAGGLVGEVDAPLVELKQQPKVHVEVHPDGARVREADGAEGLEAQVLDRCAPGLGPRERAVGLVVVLQNPQRVLGAERRPERLPLSPEAHAHQAVPLAEVHLDRGVPGHDLDHHGVDLRRGVEAAPGDFAHAGDLDEEPRVQGQAAVVVLADLRDEPLRELLLEHEDRAAEERAVREEAEDEGRGDLVRHVGRADVEDGPRAAQHVRLLHLEVRPARIGGPLPNLCGHSRVDLVRHHALRPLEQPDRHVTGSRTDLEDRVAGLEVAGREDLLHDAWVLEHVLAMLLVDRQVGGGRGRVPQLLRGLLTADGRHAADSLPAHRGTRLMTRVPLTGATGAGGAAVPGGSARCCAA
mmetsp:Transcript_17832/g.53666  ORF Transcript_17832/g.53666 Transcript_17832/m.53666 type:complete len:400 (+) Transcript_17832:82-1281(+)